MTRNLKLSILLALSLPAALRAAADTPLLSLPADTAALRTHLCQPRAFAPVPRAGSPFWRDSVPAAIRRSYIKYGEAYAGKVWPSLRATLFAEFKANGNRTRFERHTFDKRRQLAALAMAEVAEGKGRFVPDIADGLWSLMDESWWGLPAHYGTALPRAEDQSVDLFNAETAALMAWAAYMFRPALDSLSPLICKRVDSEIERRMLRPALKGDYWWKRAGMNWNPWICSNWLACVLFCERDRDRQLAAVKQIMMSMDTFVRAYPDDGGCDEGPDYWDRAAASLYDCMRLLSLATGNRLGWGGHAKVRAMAAYAYKTYIGNGYSVNFADAHSNRLVHRLNVVYPMALYLDDSVLRGYAAYLAQSTHFDTAAATLYDGSGNYPVLGRELLFLPTARRLMAEQPREPLLADTWLPRLQVMTARRGQLFVAAKGGHNDESHNHNDVGSFVVYAGGEPLLADPGVGEYTSQTFGGGRYAIWTMQSQYHNLPQVNGADQRNGRSYAAGDVSYRPGRLSLNLAGAYPAGARIDRWQRTVAISGGRRPRVTLTDSYRLDTLAAPVRLMFVTPCTPQDDGKGCVTLGAHTLRYDPRAIAGVEVESLAPKMDAHLQRMWRRPLYRVVMTVAGKAGERGAVKRHLTFTVE